MSIPESGEGEKRKNKTINSRDKVGLELVQVDVEGTVKAQRRCDGRDNLRNQPVQVREAGLGDVEAMLADVVDSLIIHLNSYI